MHDVCNVRKQQGRSLSCMLCRFVNFPEMAPVRAVCPSQAICRARWATRRKVDRRSARCSIWTMQSQSMMREMCGVYVLARSLPGRRLHASRRRAVGSYTIWISVASVSSDTRRLLVGSHYYEGFSAYVLPVILNLLRVRCPNCPAMQARLRLARSGYQCQTAAGKTPCVCDDVTFDLPRERALVATLSSPSCHVSLLCCSTFFDSSKALHRADVISKRRCTRSLSSCFSSALSSVHPRRG